MATDKMRLRLFLDSDRPEGQSSPRSRYRVFVDFDDTLTMGGVGDALLERFSDGSHRDLWRRYLAGGMTLRELDRLQYPLIRATREEVAAFAAAAEARPGLQELLDYCAERGVPVAVVSGGLEEYVRPFLARHALGHLPVYANRAAFDAAGRIAATESPHVSPHPEFCDHCAVCKTFVIDRLRMPGERVVLVGDGSNDLCPALIADHVFARRRLRALCEARGIPHMPFETLHEVREGLARLLDEP